MVKVVAVILRILAVMASSEQAELDEAAMLQLSSVAAAKTPPADEDLSAWREDDDCSWLGLDRSVCPMSALDDLEAAFEAEEASLSATIDDLEMKIEEQQDLTAEAEAKTELYENKTAAALAKTMQAEASIIIIEDRMKAMNLSFDAKTLKLNNSINALTDKMNNVINNAQCISGFLVDNQYESPHDTALLQGKRFWFWKPDPKPLAAFIAHFVNKVEDKVEAVLESNDKVFEKSVDEARAGFKLQAEQLEADIATLQANLATEESLLTAAVADRSEARTDFIQARSDQQIAKQNLKNLKDDRRVLAQTQSAAIQKLREEMNALKAWENAFKARFSQSLYKALSSGDFCADVADSS